MTPTIDDYQVVREFCDDQLHWHVTCYRTWCYRIDYTNPHGQAVLMGHFGSRRLARKHIERHIKWLAEVDA